MKRIGIFFVGFVILGVTVFYLFSNKNISDTNANSGGWNEYRNVARGFTLNYPKELSVKEYDEGDTTYTIVFSDRSGEKSFQLFFTPYLGNTITEERIRKDIASGKAIDPVEVIIGGSIHALAFWNESSLGRLREVWFIHDGYIYEATAVAELDAWLAEIMDSFRFFQKNPAGGDKF